VPLAGRCGRRGQDIPVALRRLPWTKWRGRARTAVAHFEEAVALRPGFAEPYCNLGDTLFYLEGKVPEALGGVAAEWCSGRGLG
jgi:hypothetical protein